MKVKSGFFHVFLVAFCVLQFALHPALSQTDRIASVKKKAEQGDMTAQLALGTMYFYGNGVIQDYVQALNWLGKSAKQGSRQARKMADVMYESGIGEPANTAKALESYRMAANDDFAGAQFRLGAIYYDGKRVEQDHDEAFRWYTKAANGGNVKAQLFLGIHYVGGLHRKLDLKEGARWLRMAAQARNAQAQFLLGKMHERGAGVEKNMKSAVAYYTDASDQNHTESQCRLGFLYATGNGVMKNNILAHKWWNIAAASGDDGARKCRDRVTTEMTFKELAEAQKLAREWAPKKQAAQPDYGPPPTEACRQKIRDHFMKKVSPNLVFKFKDAVKTSIDDPEKPGHKIHGWQFEATWNFNSTSKSNFPMAGRFLTRSDSVILHAPIFGPFEKWSSK
jgi:TPR repeat protein